MNYQSPAAQNPGSGTALLHLGLDTHRATASQEEILAATCSQHEAPWRARTRTSLDRFSCPNPTPPAPHNPLRLASSPPRADRAPTEAAAPAAPARSPPPHGRRPNASVRQAPTRSRSASFLLGSWMSGFAA